MFSKWILRGIALLGLPLYSAPFFYVVDNSVPPGTGSIAVFDQATFLPVAGSPFVNQPIAAGEQILIALSPDGTKLYATGFLATNTVSMMDVDPTTGAISNIQNLTGPQGSVLLFNQPFGVTVGSDGSVYVSNFGSVPGTVYKMDKDLNYLADISLAPYQNIAAVVIDSTDTYLYCVSTGNSRLFRIDTSLTGFTSVASGGLNPYACAIHPNDTYVYVTHVSSEISRFDPDLSNPLTVLPPGSSAPIGMAFDPDGLRMYVANSGGGGGTDIMVLDTTTLMPVIPALSSGGLGPFFVGVDPEGLRLYNTNSATGNFYVRDIVHDTYPFVYDSGPILGVPYGMVFTPAEDITAPVRNLSLKQFKNDFGIMYEQVNQLKWEAPDSAPVAGYYVYKNGSLIATLEANQTQYADHNTPRKTRIVYSVTSFDASGNESDPVDVVTSSS